MSAFVEFPESVRVSNARVKASWPGSLERVHACIDAYRALAEHLCLSTDGQSMGSLEIFSARVEAAVAMACAWRVLASSLDSDEELAVLRQAREIAGADARDDDGGGTAGVR
ncbi:MAG: hypothetical protein EBS94_16845 [Proteobacteria bacterium]|nr:hypothetical protein [Pseudomonadota bacterium]